MILLFGVTLKNNKRKTYRKNNVSRIDKLKSWLDSHKLVGFCLIFSLVLVIGFGVNQIFNILPIPLPYKEINYSFPLYLNLFCLVYRVFDYLFLDSSRTKMSLKRFTELFIYLNSIGLIIHLFIGISGKNSKGILPSLLSLDHRYIWFPIASYLIFFSLASIIILVMNYIEKKRS